MRGRAHRSAEPAGGQAPAVPQGALHPGSQQHPACPRRRPGQPLSAADRPAAQGETRDGEFSQILQTLPERGFNLTYLCTSLLLVLALSAAVLKVVLPSLRRNLRWRIAGSLLLGNLTFVLLHGFVVFKLGEFLLWSGFRPEHYYLAWAAWCWAGASARWRASTSTWAGVHGAVRHRAAGEFHEDRHLRVPLGGTISATWWRCCASCWSSTRCCRCWRCARPLLVLALRPVALDPAHPGRHRRLLCAVRVRHPDRQQAAGAQHSLRGQSGQLPQGHHPLGPGLYLFNLVDEMLQSGSVFRYPLQINEFTLSSATSA